MYHVFLEVELTFVVHMFLYDLPSIHNCYNNGTFNGSLSGTPPVFTQYLPSKFICSFGNIAI